MNNAVLTFNKNQCGKLWNLNWLPPDWAGTALLRAGDSNGDGRISESEKAQVDWAAFSQTVLDYQTAQGLAADGKLGAQTYGALSAGRADLYPIPDLSGMTPNQKMIAIAQSQVGVEEAPGTEIYPKIMAYRYETGLGSDSTNEPGFDWCSVFMNWCALKAGLPRSGNAWARDWHNKNIGAKVASEEVQQGDVAVFGRGNKGHVGLFHAWKVNKTKIEVLGGNQGDSVKLSNYPVDGDLGGVHYRLLSFRRLG